MSNQLPVCLKFEDNFWEKLLWDKELSDVAVELKDSNGKVIWDIKVHSIVMRRRSQVFKETLATGGKIVIEGVSVAILQKFIRFLYLGDVYVENRDEMIQLVFLGSKYSVASLREELENSLIRFLTLFNACDSLQVAVKYGLPFLQKAALSLICRAALIVFASGDFQRLNKETLALVLADDRLNVTKEFEVLQALLCWAKGNAFFEGQKLEIEALVKKVEPLLKHVRLDFISTVDRASVPKAIAELIFPKLKDEEKSDADEKEKPDDDQDAEDKEVKANDEPEKSKERQPSKDLCLASYFAEILLREKASVISWAGLATTPPGTLLIRFSVTMPIYLGGFLMVYNIPASQTMKVHITIRNQGAQGVDTTYTLNLRDCNHKLHNEHIGTTQSYHSNCFEPDTPVLMSPGEECNVFMIPTYVHNSVAQIAFPFTSIRTGEGPEFRLHMDNVRAVRKIYFLSACGRCSMNSFE